MVQCCVVCEVLKKARKLDRPRAKAFGPAIDLYEAEWRQKGRYEPPIRWEAVPGFLFAVAILFWLVAWKGVRKHEIDPGWLWFIYPTEWDLTALWSYLTALL
jgi:hypothetical protein